MTEQSLPPEMLKLPPDSQIVYDQLMTTHSKVEGLYPLMSLLTVPEDQRETLGEKLAELLTTLTQTLETFQEQHQEITKAIRDHMTTSETAAKATMEQWDAMDNKLNNILTMLNIPLD